MTVSPAFCLYVAAAIFCVGAYGVLARSSALVVLMSLEIMLNAVNLAIVSLGRTFLAGRPADPGAPHVFVLVVLGVAAAEAAVGLSLLLVVFRKYRTTQTNLMDELKG